MVLHYGDTIASLSVQTCKTWYSEYSNAASGILTVFWQSRFRKGLYPAPRWGSLQGSPDALAGLRGPTSNKREGERERGKERGRGEEGKGKDRPLTQIPGSANYTLCSARYETHKPVRIWEQIWQTWQLAARTVWARLEHTLWETAICLWRLQQRSPVAVSQRTIKMARLTKPTPGGVHV